MSALVLAQRARSHWAVGAALALALGAPALELLQDEGAQETEEAPAQRAPELHLLEVVTPEVEATCASLTAIHGVPFGDPVEALGSARTAELAGGSRISVRAPMHDQERATVRTYFLVDDLARAVEAAAEAGAEIALPDMEIPGQGRIAIYFLGGIEYGLWQR